MVQSAGGVGVHFGQTRQDFGHPCFALGRGLGFRVSS
jgi:hypothetical protein